MKNILLLFCCLISFISCKENERVKIAQNPFYGLWKLDSLENVSVSEIEKWRTMTMDIKKKSDSMVIITTSNSQDTKVWSDYSEWRITKSNEEIIEMKRPSTHSITIHQLNSSKIKIVKYIQHSGQTLDICCFQTFYFVR